MKLTLKILMHCEQLRLTSDVSGVLSVQGARLQGSMRLPAGARLGDIGRNDVMACHIINCVHLVQIKRTELLDAAW